MFNISPKEFLVPAGAEVGVQVQVSDLHLVELDARSASKNSFLGTIAIFHGSEMLRQAMILARRQEGAGRLSFSPNLLGKLNMRHSLAFILCRIRLYQHVYYSFNSGIDFTDLSFANKNQFAPITYPGQVDINDLRQFNAKTQKEVVEICGKRRARSASPSRAVEFKCLHGEETLSESRLNCTVVDRSVMMQPTMGTVQVKKFKGLFTSNLI